MEAKELYREGWFFDNPSLGRAIRYTFAEKRLARAVFVNALLLVVALAGPGIVLVTGLGSPYVDNLARNILVLQELLP